MFIKVDLEAHNIVFFEHAITDLGRIANIFLQKVGLGMTAIMFSALTMRLILHRGFVQRLVSPCAVGSPVRDLLSPNGYIGLFKFIASFNLQRF
jgi:hypothetical protein